MEERRRKIESHIRNTLAKLEIELTAEQEGQLREAFEGFGPRRDEIWNEVKSEVSESGVDVDWGPVIEATNRRIQDEFTGQIAEFLDAGDAERISARLITGK